VTRTVRLRFRLALARLKLPRASAGRAAPARRRKARPTLLWFGVAALALNAVVGAVSSDARVRDPEYGRRMSQLSARLAENPGRPLVLVVGSSRAAMGVRPAEWEATRPADPARPDLLLFNAALLGSGPIMEQMVLRRAYADGFRPSVVLIEYWPPFLHNDGGWVETHRIARDRLMDVDRPLVRDYFPDAARIEREMDWKNRVPAFGHRERLLVQVAHRWVPPEKRTDWTWDDLDGWGWKPAPEFEPGLTSARAACHARCADIYNPLFAAYRVAPAADRAFRETVALARAHGAAVGFMYLPESTEFRKLYPERVERVAREHLAGLSRDLDVPVLDTRDWIDDALIMDGFHLTRPGAAAYTRKLGPAVAQMFPKVGGRP
jgi:hypothetical protein